MGKRYMTLEDLYNFYFSQGKTQNFSCYANNGDVIVVQTPGNLKFEKNEALDGLYPTRVQMNFVGDNLNNSRIEMKAQKNALPSSHYRPLLAYIHEVDGEPQFYGHNMELDEDGNTVYLEQPVGVIAEEAHIEHDDEYDMDYAVAMGYIWEEYSQASYILDRDKECDVSVELSIRSLSYNAKDEILVLDDFYYSGCTILGVDDHGNKVNPAMPGSNITLKDFSTENNSVKFEKDDRIVELLQQLSDKIDNLSGYTKEDLKEGGKTPMSKFEELLEQYGKTAEEIEFDYSEMSDEDLEAKFAELFDGDGDDTDDPDDTSDDEPAPPQSDIDDESDSNGDGFDDEEVAVDSNDEIKKIEYSVMYGENKKEFSVSLSDIIYALSELVNDTYADDCSYYGVDVFADDNYVIMQDYWTGKAYKQSFKKKKDCYSLVGDRVPVKAVFLTEDEEKALDDMRSNYSSISEKFEEVQNKLNKYEEEPSKMEILNSEEYSQIASTEEFEAFKVQEAHFDMSVDEVRAHADELLLNYAKGGLLKFAETKEVGMKKLPAMKTKTSRYGNLFSK